MHAFALSEAGPPPGSGDELQETDRPAEHVPEAENKFQKAIAAWRGVNLSGLIPQLDATASEIVLNQRDALVERKEVAQKTKDFRKLDDSSKLTEYKSLLKGNSLSVWNGSLLLTRSSVSNLHRSDHGAWQDIAVCLPATLYPDLRCPRSISSPRSVC